MPINKSSGVLGAIKETVEGFTSKTPSKREEEFNKKRACEAQGGTWDSSRQMCILQPPKQESKPEPKPKITKPKVNPDVTERITSDGRTIGATIPDGRTFLGLSNQEVELLATQQKEKQAKEAGLFQPEGTAEGQARSIREGQQLDIQNQQLAQGVGQFEQGAINPTGLDVGEAATAGVVGAIPKALGLAAGGAALGAAGGTAVLPGVGTVAGAAIGAAAGFVSGLASSMIGSFKSQRRDTTTAQQRVLDEGKQTMKDWATLAKNDPVNKAFYLAEYNKQSAQINQAYRQMKLDTSKDVAKFETALPNLAEFESFYSEGGERDTLDIEMRNALLVQTPEAYDLLELDNRRNKK